MLKPVITATLLLLAALAHGASPEGIQVSEAWMRATPPQAPTAAGYLTVVNRGARPDRLVSITSEAAERVELHSSDLRGGVMRMRRVDDGVALPVGARVTLAPSGAHLMFIAPRRPLQPGQVVTATLRFAHAAPQVVQFKILPIGAMPEAGAHDMHDMPGMKM
jgi:copper(I)-binding protein